METDHPQVWLECPERNLLTEVDEDLVGLLEALGKLGIETLFSCQGDARHKDSKTWNESDSLGYILMRKNSESMEFIQKLLSDYPIFKANRRSLFQIEFNWHRKFKNRICVRFPNAEIPLLEKFAWDLVKEKL